MITANELKTKGIACLEENLADKPEAVITVRGKECFVVMKIEHYHYLREMELEAALYEAQQDVAADHFTKDNIVALPQIRGRLCKVLQLRNRYAR